MDLEMILEQHFIGTYMSFIYCEEILEHSFDVLL